MFRRLRRHLHASYLFPEFAVSARYKQFAMAAYVTDFQTSDLGSKLNKTVHNFFHVFYTTELNMPL
jgi:hypothetical protein